MAHKILLITCLLALFINANAQENILVAETGEVQKLGKAEVVNRVIGSTAKNFFIETKEQTGMVATKEKIYAFDKASIKQLWVHEVNKPKRGKTYSEMLKNGVLLMVFNEEDEPGMTLSTVLLDAASGAEKKLDNNFLIKNPTSKGFDRQYVKMTLFNQDSSKFYVFTKSENSGIYVTAIRISDLSMLWTKPIKTGSGDLFNLKIDNNDNVVFLQYSTDGGKGETYLCKYDFKAEALQYEVITAGNDKIINEGINKFKVSTTGVDVKVVFNSVKMNINSKDDKLFLGGFYRIKDGKPGYFLKTYSIKDFKLLSEKNETFPEKIDQRLSLNDYSKTDFSAYEIVKAQDNYYLVGQQYRASNASLYDYLVVSFDASLKSNVTLIPPQMDDAIQGLYLPNCVAYGDKMFFSFIKTNKKITAFTGTDVYEKFTSAIQLTEGKKSADVFLKFGLNGIEDAKVLAIAENRGKSGVSFEDRIGSSSSFNYEVPYSFINDGPGNILLVFTNKIRTSSGYADKYCIGKVKLK